MLSDERTNRNLVLLLNILGIAVPGQSSNVKTLIVIWYANYLISVSTVILCLALDMFYNKNGYNMMKINSFTYMILLHFQIILTNYKKVYVLGMFEIRISRFNRYDDFHHLATSSSNLIVFGGGNLFALFLDKFAHKLSLVFVLAISCSPFVKFLTNTEDFSGLVFVCWYPWQIDNRTVYCLTYALQFITVSVSLIGANTYVLFLLYVCVEIRLQNALRCLSLRNIIIAFPSSGTTIKNHRYGNVAVIDRNNGEEENSNMNTDEGVKLLIEQFNHYRTLIR